MLNFWVVNTSSSLSFSLSEVLKIHFHNVLVEVFERLITGLFPVFSEIQVLEGGGEQVGWKLINLLDIGDSFLDSDTSSGFT